MGEAGLNSSPGLRFDFVKNNGSLLVMSLNFPDDINWESHVLLWSEKQRCFHIETVHDLVHVGLTALSTGAANEYFPVGIFESREECHSFADALKATGGVPEQTQEWFDEKFGRNQST